MALTATQLANTSAAAFDVRLRFFADGGAFDERTDLADYTADAAPTGWTISGDTITPAGSWAELSDVAYEGQYVEEWTEGQRTWSAQLRGWNYDPAKLAVGRSLLCLRRYENLASGGAELITNGGFETYTGTRDDGASDTFTGWTAALIADGLGNKCEATATAQAGSAAVKFSRALGAPYIYQTITVTPGKLYRLHFWTRGDGTRSGQYKVRNHTAGADIIAQTSTDVTGTTYTERSVIFAAPAGCVSVGVYVYAPSTAGTAYFDGVSVVECGQDWHLWWLGVVDAGGWQDDYRKGQPWQRAVRSAEATLALQDAPRLTIGRLRVEEGASVTASSTLAVPGAEAGNGEFVGATANVDASNVVDGRTNTVWISQDPPSTTGETPAAYVPGAGVPQIVIDEVFIKPLAGYSAASTWWFEIFNKHATSEYDLTTDYNNLTIVTKNTDGAYVCLEFKNKGQVWKLSPLGRGIICANAQVFEAYTGGARNADFVIDARAFQSYAWDDVGNGPDNKTLRDFNLDLTNGFIALLHNSDTLTDRVHWGSPTMDAYLTGGWAGAGLDVAALPAGSSWRRSPSGTDTNVITDWAVEPYPTPGDKWDALDPQWLLIELREHTSTLSADTASGATTLAFDEGTTGWPGSGTGVIEADDFSYTGRTGTTLTGVTGLTNAHARGALAYPTDAPGAAMTGWRCAYADLVRLPGRSTIYRGSVRTSEFAECRQPDTTGEQDADWMDDYDPAVIRFENGGAAAASVGLWGRWVRSLLIFVDQMSDGGRAKLNELRVQISALDVNASELADIDDARTIDVVKFLIAHHSWYASDTVVTDGTPADWGTVGSLATGVAPLPGVIADLCRGTGCVAAWTRDGKLRVNANPWWPGGATSGAEVVLAESYLREQVRVSDGPRPATGVALTAQDGAGNTLERYVVPPGASGSGVVELANVTVADANRVGALAWNEYFRAVNTERADGLTIKGIGEWCAPGQRVVLNWDDTNYGQWIVERVTQAWRMGERARDWRTSLDCRKFFVG